MYHWYYDEFHDRPTFIINISMQRNRSVAPSCFFFFFDAKIKQYQESDSAAVRVSCKAFRKKSLLLLQTETFQKPGLLYIE